ncbi:phage minor head protein, partial [Yersinia pestis]
IKMLQDQLIEEVSRIPLNDAPDTPPISITARFSAAIQKLAELKVSDLARRMTLGMVNRANTQNKRQTQSAYKSAFGIDLSGLLGDEPIKVQMQEAIADNVALIKSIHTDFINDVGGVVFGNLAKGGRHGNLVSLIRERGKVTESRARLIARDQTAKLNSSLTQARSAALGVDLYEWGGAGDERERSSHFVLNGKTCKYSDPTVYSDDGGKTWKKRPGNAFIGHPGEDYQCRCVALPVVQWD